jgi:hypothetical protein
MKITLIAALLLISTTAYSDKSAEVPFSTKAWLEDYATLKSQLEESYANLIWFASPEGNLDLPSLDARTTADLRRAKSDAEASTVLESFIQSFHDGHFQRLSSEEGPPVGLEGSPLSVDRSMEPALACAALRYVHKKGIAFSLPFEALPGFKLISDGSSKSFRTGTASLSNGKKIGIIRIPEFTPGEYPAECEAAWKQIRSEGHGQCDEDCREKLEDSVSELIVSSLAARIQELKNEKVEVLLVDLQGNGGGTELGDWTPRLFGRQPMRSAKLALAHGEPAAGYFEEQSRELKRVLDKETSPTAQAALSRAKSEYDRLASLAHAPLPCKMNWVWHARRKWEGPFSKCSNLVSGNIFFSGTEEYLADGSLGSREAEKVIYWPSIAAKYVGTWTGPVYVAVDRRTASAAEGSAAVYQDNGVAKIIGTSTYGSGCGVMHGGSDYVLPHSRFRYRIPNCVRFRKDGGDEVKGITPDLLISLVHGGNDLQRTQRFLEAISKDMKN